MLNKEEVYVRHFRRYDVDKRTDRNPEGLLATGGCTIAVLHEDDTPGSGLVWGISRCSPSDTFVRRPGYVKAAGMARSKKYSLYTKDLDRRHINGLAVILNSYIRDLEMLKRPTAIPQERMDVIVGLITRPTPITIT